MAFRLLDRTLQELVELLQSYPNDAFIMNNGEQALVFDTERDAILLLRGDFTGLPDEITWSLRHAIDDQHPIEEDVGGA